MTFIGFFLTATAHGEEFWSEGQESSEQEVQQAEEALKDKGINLYTEEENCQMGLASEVTQTFLIHPALVKILRLKNNIVEYTFVKQICTGEKDCVAYLLSGQIDLNTGEKKINQLGIQSQKSPNPVGQAVQSNSSTSDGVNVPEQEMQKEEKVRDYQYGKKYHQVAPLMMLIGEEITEIPTLTCKSRSTNVGRPK